jgi:hypothetical protein
MGNPRGVRRDFEALERRRFEAVKLFGKNLNNSEIGRRLKVSNQTVSRWRKECKEGGNVVLRRAGRAGRASKSSRPLCMGSRCGEKPVCISAPKLVVLVLCCDNAPAAQFLRHRGAAGGTRPDASRRFVRTSPRCQLAVRIKGAAHAIPVGRLAARRLMRR